MPASVLLWILVACIFVIPVVLRLAIGDDDPDNAVTQVQEGEPRRDPDAELAVAAGRKAMKAVRVTLSR